jgi:hypothetical protein
MLASKRYGRDLSKFLDKGAVCHIPLVSNAKSWTSLELYPISTNIVDLQSVLYIISLLLANLNHRSQGLTNPLQFVSFETRRRKSYGKVLNIFLSSEDKLNYALECCLFNCHAN